MSRFYLPATDAEQWAQLLADPEKHWRRGYSARSLAYSWQEADGFPAEVRRVLAPAFPHLELLLAFPEHLVPLPGGTRSSQNDIWALARSGNELVSIAVEGKVAEPFGPTVEEWLLNASEGKQERLKYLRGLLGLESTPQTVRYQLLHRTASALIEAARFQARHALVLIHSFSPTGDWYPDYAAFVQLLGGTAERDRLVSVGDRGGISLSLAWVSGDTSYLSR